MKKLFSILIISLMISSCGKKTVSKNGLTDILNNYYTESLDLNPMSATYYGDKGYNGLLRNNLTQSFKLEEKAFYTKYLDLLKSCDSSNFSELDRLNYEVLKWQCNIMLEGLKFHQELMPVSQIAADDCTTSLHITIGQLATGTGAQPFNTVKDYYDWLSRLDGFVVWCDTAVENMKTGIKKGYVLPRVLAERVIPQLEELIKGSYSENLFYKPLLSFPAKFSETEKVKLKKAYSEKIQTKIIPVLTRLYLFFKNDYLPHCRESSGIADLPDGKEFYSYLIKLHTTATLGADEIFDLGNKEVERITKEMEHVKEQAGYNGSLISFFDFVRKNKNLMPYKTPEEVIDHFKNIHEIVESNIKNLFDFVPRTRFEIRRTEAFREKSASAEYIPASLDGSRPGIFYVPVPDAPQYNIFYDESLFLHEAIPGHHFQGSIQQEDTTQTKFHRTLWYDAYGEGWALYSESLGKDLGLYKDPYLYFGMLSEEMHRAIRLVVDVGIHSKGWTREQAIKYSLEHEAETESSITAEIERYMAWPGQALSYKLGQLKITELRGKTQQVLGDKFDIRKFHHQILESGNLPLVLLENKINRWIEQEKKSK